jgi:hypothetical protein
MKKLATILVALAAIAALAAPASATQFWLETFSYGNGALATVGSVNWNSFSTAPPTDIQIVSGVAVGDNSKAPDDQRPFTARGTTDKTYACTQVTIPTPGALPIVGNYFMLFKDPVNGGTAPPTAFVARVYAMPVPGASNVFNFAISLSSANTTTAPLAVFPLNCTFGTRYNVVFRYDATGSATLWVNPSSELSTSVTSNTTTASNAVGALINNFALRQSNSGFPSGTPSWTYNVDNVGVGTTMADACVGSVTKAQSATWGLLRQTYR